MIVFRSLHDSFVPVRCEFLLVKIAIWSSKGILADDITCQACEQIDQVDDSAGPFEWFKAGDDLIYHQLHRRLQLLDQSFGEKRCNSAASDTVKLMANRGKRVVERAKTSDCPSIFLFPSCGWANVELVIVPSPVNILMSPRNFVAYSGSSMCNSYGLMRTIGPVYVNK